MTSTAISSSPCDGIRYDLILLDMIEDMAKRYPGVHTDQFFMFGHSGGGQFVNRFLLAHLIV